MWNADATLNVITFENVFLLSLSLKYLVNDVHAAIALKFFFSTIICGDIFVKINEKK